MATRSPRATPCSRNNAATRSHSRSMSRYVSRRSSHTSAILSGSRAALRSRKCSTCNVCPLYLKLALDELHQALDGIEIGRDKLLIVDRDLILTLQKADQLQDSGRVDDAALQKRFIVVQVPILLPEEKVLHDEVTYLVLNGLHV